MALRTNLEFILNLHFVLNTNAKKRFIGHGYDPHWCRIHVLCIEAVFLCSNDIQRERENIQSSISEEKRGDKILCIWHRRLGGESLGRNWSWIKQINPLEKYRGVEYQQKSRIFIWYLIRLWKLGESGLMHFASDQLDVERKPIYIIWQLYVKNIKRGEESSRKQTNNISFANFIKTMGA